jgi:threonine/homoserine/homoserine lactone efflux protein
MSAAVIVAIVLFAVSTTVSPGPNNVMLTASGANFGLRRTLPHMLGVIIGFPFLIGAIGLGLGAVFIAYPQIHVILKYLGCAYILWLAFRIASADPVAANGGAGGTGGTGGNARGRPLSFMEAALFQWVNPKAWIMAVSAIATYTNSGASHYFQVGVLVAIFMATAVGSSSLWTMVGVGAARMLRTAGQLRAFNMVMGALLVLAIVPILWG